jgi:hypothetical protein
MKTILASKAQQLASSLLTVLVICSILSVSTMSYLSLTEQQNALSSRSQSWNVAIAVTEAGLEEGLQQLNNNTWNLTADGWTGNNGVYSFTRTLFDANSYTVTIDMSADPFHPTIISRAYVSLAAITVSPPLAAIGLPGPTPNTVARAVRVRCARGNLLIKGMVAKHTIDMNGNDILTDSFDSSDPNWSTAGQYDPNKTRANGDIATNDGLRNSLSTGNANIYGHAVTGPGGNVAVGSNGGVGEQSWVASHHGQVETGYFSDNANFTFPDQILPYGASGSQLLPNGPITVGVTNYISNTNATTSDTYPSSVPNGGVKTNTTWTTGGWKNVPGIVTNCSSALLSGKNYPAAGTYCVNPPPWQTGNGQNNNSSWSWYGIGNYTYPSYTYTYDLYSTNYTVTGETYDNVLTGGNYYAAAPLSGKTLVLGACNLVLPRGINMSGNDVLQISQSGSINIYVGANSSVGGNGVVNQNGYAINCQLFCTPNVTSFTLNGNGTFTGIIIAPEAAVQMNGGGKSYEDFIGCLMAASIKMNGHFKFHYDESLSRSGANSRYIATSWDEINPTGY